MGGTVCLANALLNSPPRRGTHAGADIGTMPYPVFQKLWKHPMTDIGLERFLADWKKTQK